MPVAPAYPCRKRGCNRKATKNGYCERHKNDSWMPNLSAERPYNTPRWRKLREYILSRDRVCCACNKELSTEADHISYHDFFNPNFIQGLCKSCHAKKTSGAKF